MNTKVATLVTYALSGWLIVMAFLLSGIWWAHHQQEPSVRNAIIQHAVEQALKEVHP